MAAKLQGDKAASQSSMELYHPLGNGRNTVSRVLFQGVSNMLLCYMHQIVVTVSCRLCPPFPEGEFAVFRYRKTPCFYGEPYYFYRISCMNSLFIPPPGNWGQKVTRNGGPQFGACLILSDCFGSQKNPRVRKIFVRNSGAGNGCANFMDAWKNASVLQEKTCP